VTNLHFKNLKYKSARNGQKVRFAHLVFFGSGRLLLDRELALVLDRLAAHLVFGDYL
jgi:hypothetical protein